MSGPAESWTHDYLQARAEAARRAEEVFAVLRQAETRADGVAGLTVLLGVDRSTASAVLEQWGSQLSRESVVVLGAEAQEFADGQDQDLPTSWLLRTSASG